MIWFLKYIWFHYCKIIATIIAISNVIATTIYFDKLMLWLKALIFLFYALFETSSHTSSYPGIYKLWTYVSSGFSLLRILKRHEKNLNFNPEPLLRLLVRVVYKFEMFKIFLLFATKIAWKGEKAGGTGNQGGVYFSCCKDKMKIIQNFMVTLPLPFGS